MLRLTLDEVIFYIDDAQLTFVAGSSLKVYSQRIVNRDVHAASYGTRQSKAFLLAESPE